MLSTMQKKADTTVVPHPSEAVFHLLSKVDIGYSLFAIHFFTIELSEKTGRVMTNVVPVPIWLLTTMSPP